MMREEIKQLLIEENGNDGFGSYRVPGIVTASNGDLLLTYEGRPQSGNGRVLFLQRCRGGEAGNRELDRTETGVQKAGAQVEKAGARVEKAGAQVEKAEAQMEKVGARVEMVRPAGDELLHNPLLIAGPEGRIWFFWCQDYGRLFLRESKDNGRTFGPARELTGEIEAFRGQWPVTLWAIAPGHGIFTGDGRLVLPLWLSRGENAHLPAAFACLTSDDFGKTWRCSNVVPAGNGVGDPTEASVAERGDGTLLATMRHEIRGVRRRAFCEGSWQENGSIQWGTAFLHQGLPDPVCSGALLSLGREMPCKEEGLLFVNCAYGDEPAMERQRRGEDIRWSLDARQRLTVRFSGDGGRRWSEGLMLEQEAGASDLAASEDGSCVYVFYEEGWEGGNCIFNRRLKLAELPLTLLKPSFRSPSLGETDPRSASGLNPEGSGR